MKVTEYGKQGSPVVMLLHGGGLSWWNYRAEAELLAGRFRVVLPVLDGHADSGYEFRSIEENAARLISLIDRDFTGRVLLIGGLSLGAQVLTEMLTQREDICRFAVIESASMIPDRITHALTGPAFGLSYGLVRQKWFAKAQFRYLRLKEDLFEDYCRDTSKITKHSMIAFLKANTAYELKPALRRSGAGVRIIAGEKEPKRMLRSAQLLHEALPGSRLEIKKGLYHGEYSVNHPDEYVRELLQMTEQGS